MSTEILVEVDAPDVSREQLFDLAESLRQEVLYLPVEGAVHRSAGPAPAGTRGIDAAVIGQILVTLSSVAGSLGPVVETVRKWLETTGSNRTIRMQIGKDMLEISGVDSKEQRRLIESWIERHS